MVKPKQDSLEKGMWLDSLYSLQPQGTARFVLNGQKESFDARGFGYVREASNVLYTDLGNEWKFITLYHIEERDLFLFFAANKKENRSIIGTISTNTREQTILVDDKDWEDKLCFNECGDIPVTSKSQQPGNHLRIYFNVDPFYYYLDLDDPNLCNITKQDLLLLDSGCPPPIEANVIEDAGAGLQNGFYQFVAQLADEVGNTTNYFKISKGVRITSPTFKAGDISDDAIRVTMGPIDGNKKWTRVNIAVIKTIGGQTNAFKLTTQPYLSSGIDFLYVGTEDLESMQFEEIFARKDYYIRGKNLTQKDGRLVLHDLYTAWNLDYQRQALKILTKYKVFRVKAEDAKNFLSLMRDEVYALAIRWNYIDGTFSPFFHIPGRAANEYDREIIPADDPENCAACDLQRWQVFNTARRTNLYCDDEYATSETSVEDFEDYQEQKVVYSLVTDDCSGPSAVGGGCGGSSSGGGNCPDGNCGEVAAEASAGGGCSGGDCGDGFAGGGVGAEECSDCEDIVTGEFCEDEDGGLTFRRTPEGQRYRKTLQAADYNRKKKVEFATGGESCIPTPIYDEDGCYIVGYNKPLVSEGEMGFWESAETYPTDLNCQGKPIYGELAGCPIRHHKMPCETIEPIILSTQTGVPSPEDPANEIDNDTFVHIVGLDLKGIERPVNPPKPLCEENPFTIGFIKRDASNSSIIGKGLLTGTFAGNVNGTEFLFPKNGVNSLEYTDGNISEDLTGTTLNPSDCFEPCSTGLDCADGCGCVQGICRPLRNGGRFRKKHRKGFQANVAAYNFHSPDTSFDRPFLNATQVKVINELYGKGYRYGQYGEGKESINEFLLGRENQRGTRQWVNLNHYGALTRKTQNVPCANIPWTITQNTCRFNEDLQVLFLDFTSSVDVDESLIESINVKVQFPVPQLITKDYPNRTEISESIIQDVQNFIFGDPFVVTYTLELKLTNGCEYTDQRGLQTALGEDNRFRCTDQSSFVVPGTNTNPETEEVPGSINRCVKGISYVPADSILKKGDDFTHSLMNLNRESSVFIEFEGSEKLTLNKSQVDPYLNTQRSVFNQNIDDKLYNGHDNHIDRLIADGTSDASFLGDTIIHNCPIHLAGGHYASVKRNLVKQYGRLESASYVSLYEGTEEDLLCGRTEFCDVGDTFITQYSFVRHSLISDKVGDRTAQKSDTGLGAALICSYTCNSVPESGDGGDIRNRQELRRFGTEDDPLCWDGQTPFDGLFLRGVNSLDDYRPNLQKTLVSFWVESKVNTALRQRGSEENCEVNYPNLGSMELDSHFPTDGNWKESFLNCYFVNMIEAAGWKKFMRSFFAIFGNLVTLGLLTTEVCWLLDRLFNIEGCAVRCLEDGGTGNCVMRRGDIKGQSPNYYRYNWDYSKVNDVEPFYGVPQGYDTCMYDRNDSKVIYSEFQDPNSYFDAFRNFKVNNYSQLPAEWGKIKDFYSVGQQFFAHTTDMVLNTYHDVQQLQTNTGDEVFLGRGGFLEKGRPILGEASEGFAGTMDPKASMSCQWGHFFVDREAKKIYQHSTQNGLDDITKYGWRSFFKENLGMFLLEDFPEFDCTDTVVAGYRFGTDHRFNRIFFTKKDYKLLPNVKLEYVGNGSFKDPDKGTVLLGDPDYFCDKSFTATFDPNSKEWLSLHSYIPDSYVWDRDHIYMVKDGSVWKQGDKKGDYGRFFGEEHPFIVEKVINLQTLEVVDTNNIVIDTEATKWLEGQPIFNLDYTFNKAIIYNYNQSTGEVRLINTNENNLRSIVEENPNEIRIAKYDKVYQVSGFHNRVKDPSQPLFDNTCELPSLDKIVNVDNIKKTTSQDVTDFEDKFIVVRLILDDPESFDKELLIKSITVLHQNKA